MHARFSAAIGWRVVTLFELPRLGRFYRSRGSVAGHGTLFALANRMCSVGVRLGPRLMQAKR
jgi:hypothetical protein